MSETIALVTETTRKGLKLVLSIGDPSPFVYLGRQAFPLRFFIQQAIKNWMVGRPGNEANGF